MNFPLESQEPMPTQKKPPKIAPLEYRITISVRTTSHSFMILISKSINKQSKHPKRFIFYRSRFLPRTLHIKRSDD